MASAKTRMRMLATVLILALAAGVSAAQVAWADDTALSAGGMSELGVQAEKDYVSPDGKVEVTGIKSGTVAYDQKTKTLTLNKLKAKDVMLYGDASFNLVLNGSSEVNVSNEKYYKEYDWYSREGTVSVTVKGKGALSGAIDINGNLTVRSGQIGAKKCKANEYGAVIECGKLTANGGKVVLDTCDGKGIKCSGLKLSKGLVKVCGQYGEGIRIVGGDLSVSGGKLAVTKCCGDAIHIEGTTTGGGVLVTGGSVVLSASEQDQFVHGIYCTGELTVKGGQVTASAKKDYKENSYSKAFGISCSKLTVKGGKVKSTASCDGKGGGAYGVSCYDLVMAKGSLDAKASGKQDAESTGVYCDSGTVKATGGELNASASSSRECYGIYTDKYDQEGGEASVKATGKSSASATGVYCDTSFKVSEGSMKVDVSSEKGSARWLDCWETKEVKDGTVTVTVNGEAVEV